MNKIVFSFQFSVFSVCLSAAEPLPLSTAYWKDPAFLKSFNGSYRIEARIEPSVSTAERGLLIGIQTLMADGKRAAALEKLQSSDLTKKSPALTFNLANLYFETGAIEKAVEAYQSVLKEFPSFRRAHHNLALAYVRENKLQEALGHLTEAVRLGDSEGSTYGMLGYCRLDRGEYASALQAYRLAQITEPEVAEWKAGIAQCLQHLDQKKEAVALLDEVIRSRPLESPYSVLQANILLDLGQAEAAVKALELPHRLSLLDPDTTLLLADLHLRAKRTETAKEIIAAAFSGEQTPGEAAILRLITTASSQTDWPLVKGLLEKARERKSARPPEEKPTRPLRLATARFLIESGDNPASGAEGLEELIHEDPTDGQALLTLGKHQATSGQPESAQLLFERATADATTAHEAHIELTRLHVSRTRYADALKSIDSAIALKPSEPLKTYREALRQTLAASE